MHDKPLDRLLTIGRRAIEMVEEHDALMFRLTSTTQRVGDLLPKLAESSAGMRSRAELLAQPLERFGRVEAVEIHENFGRTRGRRLGHERAKGKRLAGPFRTNNDAAAQAGLDEVFQSSQCLLVTCADEAIVAQAEGAFGAPLKASPSRDIAPLPKRTSGVAL